MHPLSPFLCPAPELSQSGWIQGWVGGHWGAEGRLGAGCQGVRDAGVCINPWDTVGQQAAGGSARAALCHWLAPCHTMLQDGKGSAYPWEEG